MFDASQYRNSFLNKFFMYKSISKTVMQSSLFNYHFHNQADMVDYLTCKDSWSMCLFDFFY